MNGGMHWEPKGGFTGAIWLYPSQTAPVGWAICDGTKFDTTKYADLAKILPSGQLPTLKAPTGVWYVISLGPESS